MVITVDFSIVRLLYLKKIAQKLPNLYDFINYFINQMPIPFLSLFHVNVGDGQIFDGPLWDTFFCNLDGISWITRLILSSKAAIDAVCLENAAPCLMPNFFLHSRKLEYSHDIQWCGIK